MTTYCSQTCSAPLQWLVEQKEVLILRFGLVLFLLDIDKTASDSFYSALHLPEELVYKNKCCLHHFLLEAQSILLRSVFSKSKLIQTVIFIMLLAYKADGFLK